MKKVLLGLGVSALVLMQTVIFAAACISLCPWCADKYYSIVNVPDNPCPCGCGCCAADCPCATTGQPCCPGCQCVPQALRHMPRCQDCDCCKGCNCGDHCCCTKEKHCCDCCKCNHQQNCHESGCCSRAKKDAAPKKE